MKKLFYFFPVFIFCALLTACSNEEDPIKGSKADDTIPLTLNFSGLSVTQTQGSGVGAYWDGTYDGSVTSLTFDTYFTFSHAAGISGAYKYYSGFVPSTVHDTNNYSDSDWVSNQWGSMSIGNIAANTPLEPFLVCYWSEYNDTALYPEVGEDGLENDTFSCTLTLNKGAYSTIEAKSVTVGFHPWSYYNVTVGDQYANPIVTPATGDFVLYVYGIKDGEVVAVAEHYFVKGGALSTTEFVEVSFDDPVEVDFLAFQMDSSDRTHVEEYDYSYINTATYFCLKSAEILGTY